MMFTAEFIQRRRSAAPQRIEPCKAFCFTADA